MQSPRWGAQVWSPRQGTPFFHRALAGVWIQPCALPSLARTCAEPSLGCTRHRALTRVWKFMQSPRRGADVQNPRRAALSRGPSPGCGLALLSLALSTAPLFQINLTSPPRHPKPTPPPAPTAPHAESPPPPLRIHLHDTSRHEQRIIMKPRNARSCQVVQIQPQHPIKALRPIAPANLHHRSPAYR